MIESHIGQHLKDYQPRHNLHRLVNELLTSPRYAFSPSAIIAQEKKFPDVSFYQAVINWDAMRGRTDAVVIRGGQGTYADIQFTRNWTVSKRLGIKRGIYWFYDDRYSPGAQAEKLFNLIQGDLPELEIWIDWELVYGGAFGGLRNVVAMMERVEALLPGVTVGLYTGFYFFVEHSNAITNAPQYNYLKSRPLWLGWYSSDALTVRIPAPWTSLLLWQFGTPAEGNLYGVESLEIDMNFFNGTQAEFTARYGGTSEPPPTGVPMIQWYRVNTAGLNMRSGPGASHSRIGGLVQGDRIEVEAAPVAGWLPIKSILRVNGTVETPEGAWCSAAYCVPTDSPVVEPPPVDPPAGAPPVHIDIQLAAGSTLTVTDADGSVVWSATA